MANWGQSHMNPSFQIPVPDTEAGNFHNQQRNVQQTPLNIPFLPYNVNETAGVCPQNNPAFMNLYPSIANQKQIPMNTGMNYPQHMQYPVPNGHPVQNSNQNFNLPQNILDQIRACANSTTPIFILPNGSGASQNPPANSAPPTPYYVPPIPVGACYPPIMTPFMHCPPTCQPYPVSFPISYPVYDPFSPMQNQRSNAPDVKCDCCRGTAVPTPIRLQNYGALNTQDPSVHKCDGSPDGVAGTICSKKNCPSVIQLQAMVAQLLSIQGIVSCAVVRLLLRRLPGSNVTNTDAEIVDRTQRCIQRLSKDQLLAESKSAHQINALIGLFLASNPIPNVIPVLTSVQLKINKFKTDIEALINRKLMENQGVGAEAPTSLDPLILGLKSDEELRQFLVALREKECEERVNLNFAPYRSQRVIAETRLANIQNKINQVEGEIEKRRNSAYGTTFRPAEGNNNSANIQSTACRNNYDSPSPFTPHTRSPKRLFLKPNVGGPTTTHADTTQYLENCCCANNPYGCCNDNTDPAKKKLNLNQNDDMEAKILKVSGNLVILVDSPKQQAEEDNKDSNTERDTGQSSSDQNSVQKDEQNSTQKQQNTVGNTECDKSNAETGKTDAKPADGTETVAMISSLEFKCFEFSQDEEHSYLISDVSDAEKEQKT